MHRCLPTFQLECTHYDMIRKFRLSAQTALLIMCLGVLLLGGCSAEGVQSASVFAGGTVTPSPQINLTISTINSTPTPLIVNTMPTSTPDEPTATSRPINIVARVNGQDITLEQFTAELDHYVSADPSSPDPNSPAGKQMAAQMKDSVLDTMIQQLLIAQDAARNHVTVSDQQVDDGVKSLIQMRGGQDQFNAWLAASKLSEQDVRDLIRRELLATAMRDRIVAQLPHTADYVHAYHIVVATQATAQMILAKLKAGARFTALAQQYSIDASTRPDGGDLGWFTRGTGTVLWTEVEDAAFALKPGQISPIVHSPIGYHIIKVVDRQTRALTPDDLAVIEQNALNKWINDLIKKATIEKYI